MVKNHPAKNQLSLREVVVASRPFWWINTGAPFFVGYLSVSKDFSWTLVIGTLYFLIFYNLFMYGVNDIYDYESDIRNPRKNAGIDGSVLAKTKHTSLWIWIWLTSIPFWLYFASLGSFSSNAWLGLIIFMALAYSIKSLRFKEVPLLDSFTSAFHYTSPFLFGILLSGGSYLWLPAYVTFYIWVMSNHAFGAIQDITPDREADIGSVATKLGSARTAVLCLVGYVTAVILPTLFYGTYGLFVSLVLLPYVFVVARTIPKRHNDKAKIFKTSWRQFLYLNYFCGFLLSIYLILLNR